MTALLLNLWGPGPLKVLSRSLTVRALVGSRPPLGDVWHAASGASQTRLRSTLNFAQNQERGLAACKTLANLPAALVDQKRARAEQASIYRSPYAQKSPLLRDRRERRVEEVVDGDHAVALVERI